MSKKKDRKKEKKSVSFDPDLFDFVVVIAKEDKTNFSRVVNQALRHYKNSFLIKENDL